MHILIFPLAILEFQVLKSLIHLIWFFVQSKKKGSGFILQHVDTQFPWHHLLKSLFFSVYVWHLSNVRRLYAVAWTRCLVLILVHWSAHVLWWCHAVFICVVLQYNFKSNIVMTSITIFLLFRITLATQSLLRFWGEVYYCLFLFLRRAPLLFWLGLHLLGRLLLGGWPLLMSFLPIHKHGRSYHLLVTSIFFFCSLKFSL